MSYTVPGLFVAVNSCRFLFTVCCDVFLTCSAKMLLTTVEDLETFCLNRKYPSQVVNVYDKADSFQVQSVGVCNQSGGGVLVLNHDRPESSSRQNSNSIRQDGNHD